MRFFLISAFICFRTSVFGDPYSPALQDRRAWAGETFCLARISSDGHAYRQADMNPNVVSPMLYYFILLQSLKDCDRIIAE